MIHNIFNIQYIVYMLWCKSFKFFENVLLFSTY
jgi:hypothetical protein